MNLASGVLAAKAAIRKKMRNIMSSLTPEDRTNQSRAVIDKLLKTPEWTNAKRVSIFLSMANEIQTEIAVVEALRSNKACFVPLCQGGRMRMLRVLSEEDLNNLPKDAWGIKEPKPVDGRDDALETGGLDLVVCPGVAFTAGGHRIGYGKGYYDRFLTELRGLQKNEDASARAATIAVGFRQQILEEIPTTEQDVLIDRILTADS